MDKTYEDNKCTENATNETAQIIGMTNHAANKCIDLFLDTKGSSKKKVGALTGTDKILFGQINELMCYFDPANTISYSPPDDYNYASLAIYEMLKSGKGEDAINEYLSSTYDRDCKSGDSLRFLIKLREEVIKKLVGLYTVETGLKDLKPLGIEQERDAVRIKACRLRKNMMQEYTQSQWKETSEILAEYETQMLVDIAAELYYDAYESTARWCYKYTEHDTDQMLDRILRERCERLNAGFRWTDENRVRFLAINDRLFNIGHKGAKEGAETVAALRRRINEGDEFTKEYTVCANLIAYPEIDGNRQSAARVEKYIAERASREGMLYYNIYHVGKGFEDFPQKQMLFNFNWGKERYFNDEFNNEKICYAIRNMLCTGIWSFPDILSIWSIQVNVDDERNYHEDMLQP